MKLFRILFSILKFNIMGPINRYRFGGFTCRARPVQKWKDIDFWFKKKNGDLVCSYCGSTSAEDVLEIAEIINESVYPSGYRILKRDSYLFYVFQLGLKNASHGGIKFNMDHAPLDKTNSDYFDKEFCLKLWAAAEKSKDRPGRKKLAKKIGMNHLKGGVKR